MKALIIKLKFYYKNWSILSLICLEYQSNAFYTYIAYWLKREANISALLLLERRLKIYLIYDFCEPKWDVITEY